MILYSAECATQVALDGIQCLGESLTAGQSQAQCQSIPSAFPPSALKLETGVTCGFFCVAGGNGYINDYPMGRFLRDAKLYEIGAGTSEVRRLVIGRAFNATFK